jgi:hypothetical protein
MAFRFTPLEAIDIMFFSPPRGATANELFAVIECPEYSEKKLLQGAQKNLFYRCSDSDEVSGFFKEIMCELEKEQENIAGDFLEFTTGSRYLPQRPTECNFKIVIEFHEKMDCDALPEAQTCVKVVKFPAAAYYGVKEIFQEKLLHALAYKERFMMV